MFIDAINVSRAIEMLDLWISPFMVSRIQHEFIYLFIYLFGQTLLFLNQWLWPACRKRP